jgi:hypothetical protein
MILLTKGIIIWIVFPRMPYLRIHTFFYIGKNKQGYYVLKRIQFPERNKKSKKKLELNCWFTPHINQTSLFIPDHSKQNFH